MNKAITDGLVFMPPAFTAGNLGLFSRGDGGPGSDTYAGLGTAAFVPADTDFGGCLEVQKTEATQKLRYMGQTPLPLGCYLRVTARVKAVSGALPSVRIAGFAARAGGTAVSGVTTTAVAVPLTSYGEVVEVSAIVGAGNRGGVDLVWGTEAVYGHFGLDLTGSNGGVVRIDDLIIEDVTGVFLRDMMSWVDVRDFGAKGDGVSDDTAAFVAADAAADGRRVLVSEGSYRLESSLTLASRVTFEGTLSMPTAAILSLTKDFSLPTYIDAFGGDEELALKKALQSLMNGADHESLDMGGRRVSLTAALDVQAAVPNRSSYDQRRVLRNGQLRAEDSGSWDAATVTSTATYSAATPWKLTGVTNVANVQRGSLVQAAGVGREVYVREVDIPAQEITLSQPLGDAVGVQTYSFTRFRFLLDFTGFERLDGFEIEGVELQCNGLASGVAWPASGSGNALRACVVDRPGHRGLVSIGDGCAGASIDLCRFVSDEAEVLAQARQSVAIVVNAADVKIRNCHARQFRHAMVVSGARALILGNHVAQGDTALVGARTAGIVLPQAACDAQVGGNSIEDCFVEWTNERAPEPDHASGESFAGLSLTGNVMSCGGVAASFGFVVVKPHGAGHFIDGLTVTGNSFRAREGAIERAERIDASFAQMDKAQFRRIRFAGNGYHNIGKAVQNPLVVTHGQNTHAQVWEIDSAGRLPFEGQAAQVEAVAVTARLRDAADASAYAAPYATARIGSGQDRVQLTWPAPLLGTVAVTLRCDG